MNNNISCSLFTALSAVFDTEVKVSGSVSAHSSRQNPLLLIIERYTQSVGTTCMVMNMIILYPPMDSSSHYSGARRVWRSAELGPKPVSTGSFELDSK